MKDNFWEGYIRPGRIWGNLYFVGTRPASTHIIDTGAALILIDAGFPEALSQILENIRAIGFDPDDIKIILLSHGHYDHAGAARELAELTNAEIYVGEGDLKMVTGEEDSSLAEIFGVRYTQFFTPDKLLRDGDVISLGNTEMLCIATPGHTEGTVSFFFDVTDGEKTYRAGMFGGAGTNTLTRDFLQSRGMSLEYRKVFLDSIEKLKKEKVDIFLGNHVENNNTEEKLAKTAQGQTDAFVTPNEWKEYLEKREKRLYKLIEDENKTINSAKNAL